MILIKPDDLRQPHLRGASGFSVSVASLIFRTAAATRNKVRQLSPKEFKALKVSRPASFYERRPLNLPVKT
jgi:hypothetical protein